MQVGGNAMYVCMFGVLCCFWKSCLMYIAGMYVRMCVRMYSVHTHIVCSWVSNVCMYSIHM